MLPFHIYEIVAAAVLAMLVHLAINRLRTAERTTSNLQNVTFGKVAAFSHLRPQMMIPNTRICLNMIVKNEEKSLGSFLESVQDHITGYFICDTGSTDSTVAVLEQFFSNVGLEGIIHRHEWKDFSYNRNACLQDGTREMADRCEYWLISEPDHVFVSENAVLLPSLNLTQYRSYFLEEHNLGLVYNNRRIVSTKLKWKYVGAVHEYLMADHEDDGLVGVLPVGIYVHHNIKNSVQKYELYRDILENEIKADPDDPRSRYYLGQTYSILNESDKAIEQFMTRIIFVPSWDEERYMAGLNLAIELLKVHDSETLKISQRVRNVLFPWIDIKDSRPTMDNIMDAFQNTANILPYRHEAWYYIAKIYRMRYNNHAKCFEYAKKARDSGPPHAQTLFSNSLIRDFHIDEELCVCGYYVQDSIGLASCKKLLAKLEQANILEYWQEELKARTQMNVEFYKTITGDSANAIGRNANNSVQRNDDILDRKVRVVFHSHQLGNRGTEVSLFDYGLWFEIFYNAEAHFAFPYPGWTPIQESPLKKFTTTFPGRIHLVHADNWDYPSYRKALDDIILDVQADALYRTELQNPGYEVSAVVPTFVHEVFNCSISRKMGDKYKAISTFVQSNLGGGCTGVVPYLVWLPNCTKGGAGDDMREELGISKDTFVFAWYGGHDAWDPAVTDIVKQVAVARKDQVLFLLQNFPPAEFLKLDHLSNVIYVPSSSSLITKCRFIHTADVFMHTRLLGETFGLAVAEFSLHGKPTITNFNTPHRFHLEMLGPHSFIYRTYDELLQIMMSMDGDVVKKFFPSHGQAINKLPSLYSDFSPCKVMKQFNAEFFDGKLPLRDGGVHLDRYCSHNAQNINMTELEQLGISLF